MFVKSHKKAAIFEQSDENITLCAGFQHIEQRVLKNISNVYKVKYRKVCLARELGYHVEIWTIKVELRQNW